MKEYILSQVPGFITGILSSLFAAFIIWLFFDKISLKFISKIFQHNKTNSEIKDIFENNIRKQFSLDQTVLSYPDIPQGINFSHRHSFGNNSYFNYLIQNNITHYIFKFWSKANTDRRIIIENNGNTLTIEAHLKKWECKEILEILKNSL